NAMRTIKLLMQMYDEDVPSYMDEYSRALIQRKRACRDYATTCMKSIFLKCEIGFPKWSQFEEMLKQQTFPEVDIIVGVVSGGFLIAQVLSRILNKPFIKLTYSRYNNKNLLQKTFIFFQKRTNLDQNKITMEQEVNANQRVLLVDDSLGSGGTMF